MTLFANTWINLDLKHAANTFIIRNVSIKPEIQERRIVKPIITQTDGPVNEHLKSIYFRDMVTVEKHMKSGYSKDVTTKKHKKSSYVKEFVSDK